MKKESLRQNLVKIKRSFKNLPKRPNINFFDHSHGHLSCILCLTSLVFLSHLLLSSCLVLLILFYIESCFTIFVNKAIVDPKQIFSVWLEANHFFKRNSIALSTAVHPKLVDYLLIDTHRIAFFIIVEGKFHEMFGCH